MDIIISLLNLFGITPDKYPFLVLGILIVIGAIYVRYSIGRKLGRIKDNVLVIISHLSAAVSTRGRLDTNLIQVMSPMFITDQGRQLLETSGFKSIVDDPNNSQEIMRYLNEQQPRSKFDVENLSIVTFSVLLERDFMNSIKTYLYNNPNMRDVFKTLGGLYIRDKYLAEHPEITQ